MKDESFLDPRILATPFHEPKFGNKATENEDAYWPKQQPIKQSNYYRFAVADGASESSYSGLWAKQLVRYYCRSKSDRPLIGIGVMEVQKRWNKFVQSLVLPWYALEKVQFGAFASIIGLTIYDDTENPGNGGKWQAEAIGDSCLVQIQDGSIVERFPLDASVSFSNSPHLLSTDKTKNNPESEDIRLRTGTWQVGDVFYLMTDALACWFMREDEEGKKPWNELNEICEFGGSKHFRQWLAERRKLGLIRNDDVTLLRIYLNK